MNQPNPANHTQNLKLQALCEDQLNLIETQRRILEAYEAELDRQASRLTKCLWTIGVLAVALIVALTTR